MMDAELKSEVLKKMRQLRNRPLLKMGFRNGKRLYFRNHSCSLKELRRKYRKSITPPWQRRIVRDILRPSFKDEPWISEFFGKILKFVVRG